MLLTVNIVSHNSAHSCSDNMPSLPPDNHHNLDVVWWRGGVITVQKMSRRPIHKPIFKTYHSFCYRPKSVRPGAYRDAGAGGYRNHNPKYAVSTCKVSSNTPFTGAQIIQTNRRNNINLHQQHLGSMRTNVRPQMYLRTVNICHLSMVSSMLN